MGGIQAFSGVDTANPIDVEDGQTTPYGLSHATPSVTTTVANAMIVTAHTFETATTWTPPSGMTEGFDTKFGGQSIEGNYILQATAGATGTKTATAAGSSGDQDEGVTHILALRPATTVAQLYFIHADHLNSPRLIANQAGQTVWRHDQAEPFGDNPADENPSGLGVFEFPLRDEGTYFDKETNLVYNWHRYRDLSGGRFVQADPLGLAGGDLSLYVLNRNNPLTYTDPLGLATYMCTRRLNWVPFRVGPLFHQYICVGNAQGGYTCGGLAPSSVTNVFDTPGIIEDDKMKPESCQVVQDDNDCVEQCIKDTFKQPPPNYSVDLSRGENCQTYANAAVIDCVARCRTKKK